MTEKQHVALRKFNRAVFNRVIKLFAGRFFYALVLHTGRISGKTYSTPVLAVKKENATFIPLRLRSRYRLVLKRHGRRRLPYPNKWELV
jgi:hypothetical protein